MLDRKRLAFWAIFGTILATASLAGTEFLASFYVPSWPARVLNPRAPAPERHLGAPYKNQPWMADGDNSWAIRDQERTVAKPAGTRRAVFVGDSFVESRFTPLSVPAAVQQRLGAADSRIEAVSLAVPATDPRSYYYRIRDVAVELHPDAVLMFIYAGNDFMARDQGYSPWPRFIDESPGGSLVGFLMPRTNWLLVNRLDLASFFRSRSKAPTNDEAQLWAAVTAPAEERLKRIVSYAKTYHFPALSEDRIAEVFSRGDNRYAGIARPQEGGEQEYLLDWMFDTLMSWETGTFDMPASRQDAARLAGNGEVEATLSWIEATDRLLRQRGVPLLVFLAPVGSVDPDYADFWSPWPRAYSWNHLCDEWTSRLAAALSKDGIRHVDLRQSLAGIPGTYRKLDGHWSQKGEAVVADRVASELRTLLSKPSPTEHAGAD
jgi:SGNH hydrolase-like domain, acetyltransferase AlgX